MSYTLKIYGERCSGTNYLKELLKKNIKEQVYMHTDKNHIVNYWKHACPEEIKSTERFTVKGDKILYIFIIRELDSWLKSFFKYQYHLVKKKYFKQFVKDPFVVKHTHKDYFSNKSINFDDEDKTVFELRYYKINSYLEFAKTHDCIFVNLYWLQQNYKKFFDIIKENFSDIRINENIVNIDKHTKTKNSIKNRTYNDIDIEEVRNLISNQTDKIMEDFVNNLTYKIEKNGEK